MNVYVGAEVTVQAHESACDGDVGEVVSQLDGGTWGVRIITQGSEFYGQTVYFNGGQLAPLVLPGRH